MAPSKVRMSNLVSGFMQWDRYGYLCRSRFYKSRNFELILLILKICTGSRTYSCVNNFIFDICLHSKRSSSWPKMIPSPSEEDREKGGNVDISTANQDLQEEYLLDGDINYTIAEGANSSTATYQDARGAPVETESPLGYSVNQWVSLCLNINQMVGTGIFSTRKMFWFFSYFDIQLEGTNCLFPTKAATILKGVGSVGLTMIYWFIGYLLSQSTLSVYMELVSYFPSRSGSDVVYLEQAYPYPQYFFPTIFAIKHVIFSFSSSNSIVFSQYLFGLAGSSYTPWQLKGVAVGVYTVALIGLWAFHHW